MRNRTVTPGQLARAQAQARKPVRKISHCHVLIAETAKGLAHVLFDEMMGKNEIWAQFKSQHAGMTTAQMEAKFVAKLWPQLIESARATLAAMLAPESNVSDDMKEEIMDALVRDKTLMRGRNRKSDQVLGTVN